MIKTINLNDFRDEFFHYDKHTSFSYAGLEVLFNHLEDLHDFNYDLDFVELKQDYTEYTFGELLDSYSYIWDNLTEGMSKDEIIDDIDNLENDFLDNLRAETTVLEFTKINDKGQKEYSYIVQDF